jgi:hypothetical protein
MNYSFFKYMETNDRDALPLPRFYIAKNRTLLHEAQQNPDGLLAILYNLKTEPTSNPDLIHLNTTVILTEPLGEIHGFDIASMNDTDNKYENCPKAWIKLRAIKIVHNVDTIINTTMEKSFFRRAYNTFRISPKIPADLKKIRNDQVAKQFVRAILDPTSSNNGVTEGTASGPVLSEIVEELGSSQSGGNNDAVGETSLEENISKTPTPSPSPSLGQPSPSIPSAQSTQSPPPSSIPKAVLNNNNNNNNSTTTSSSSPINKVNNTGIKKVIMTVEKKPPTAAPPSSPTPPKIVIPKRSITSISAARAMIEGRSLQQSQQEAVKSPVSSKPSSAASSPTQSPLTTSPKKITLSFQRYLEGEQDDLVSSKEYYLEKSKESWKKLKECKFLF